MRTSDYCIVSTTVPSQEYVEVISQALLQRHLVACIQAVEVQSRYVWQGSVEQSQEILLQMKSVTSYFEIIKTEIERHHPYDVPEIVMTPILEANRAYLEWISQSVDT